MLRQKGGYQSKVASFDLRALSAQGLIERHVALDAAVGVLGDEGRLVVDDERFFSIDDEALDAAGDALHGALH